MKWQIVQDGEQWKLVGPDGTEVEAQGRTRWDSYQAALSVLAQLLELQAAEGETAEGDDARAVRSDLMFEGVETDEGGLVRIIDQGATEWREPPQPIMLQTETDIGHFGAELCGRFTSFTRVGDTIVGEGFLDHSEAGDQALQILTEHGRFGISADPVDADYDEECTEYDEDGWCMAARMEIHNIRIAGGTLTPFPAFEDAFMELSNAEAEEETEEETETEDTDEEVAASAAVHPLRPDPASLVAASVSIPSDPPSSYFEDPGLTALTPMTVMADGRVFGHAAPWDSCHMGSAQGAFDACVVAPHSPSEYAYFRTGEVRPGDCDCPVPTGAITLGTNHPSVQLAHLAAADHYANTGDAIADVACGEDEFGIWFSGALRPGTTDEQIRALRGSAISGDWRKVAGSLELIAMLAVNTPGFPIPRVQARVASGAPQALVAAGVQVMAKGRMSGEQRLIGELQAEVRSLRAIVEPLQPMAREALKDRIAASATS